MSRSTHHENLYFLVSHETRRSSLPPRYKFCSSLLHRSRFAISEFASSEFAVSVFAASTQAVVAMALHVTSVEHVYRHIPSSTSRNVSVVILQSPPSCRCLPCNTLSLPFLYAIVAEVSHHVLHAQQRRSLWDCCADLRPAIIQAALTPRPTRRVLPGKRASNAIARGAFMRPQSDEPYV